MFKELNDLAQDNYEQEMKARTHLGKVEQGMVQGDGKNIGLGYLPLSVQKDSEALEHLLSVVTEQCKQQNVRILFEQRDQAILKAKMQTFFKDNVSNN